MTRSDIVAMIDVYIAAEKAVIKNKSYTIGNRSYTRSNLPEIREGRQEWEQRLAEHDMQANGSTNTNAVADWR